MSLNRFVCIGRLVRDPEAKQTKQGKDIAVFTVAVDRKFKSADGPNADFFRCKAWGKTAEYVCKYGSKGVLISVEGSIEIFKITGDGTEPPRDLLEVVCDNVDILEWKEGKAAAQAERKPVNSLAPKDEWDPFEDS